MSIRQCASLAALWLLFLVTKVSSFVVTNTPSSTKRTIIVQMSDLDYEYIPSDATFPPQESRLESVFPPDTPAGLRGEAVRSALKSGRCIAWKGNAVGVLQVQGKGTIDFLSNKLSQSFADAPLYKRACLLTPKGRLVDLLNVAVVSRNLAYMLTSPGHDGEALFERLNPLIFPMDQVELTNTDSFMFSIASVNLKHVQDAIENYMAPLLKQEELETFQFPSKNSIRQYELKNGATLVVLPDVFLPFCACVGYTFVFVHDSEHDSATKFYYKTLVGDDTPEGPVEIGPLEYETLRIEAGQPSFGFEYTAGCMDDKSKTKTPANPMELHLQSLIDMDKGCYLGQEGIASVLKNKRGPPRTLYSVVFDDQDNLYQHQTASDQDDNLTTVPLPGQELFVLGSHEQISVGFLTSVAEPGGTGDAHIVALALVKRSDSIQSKMKELDIQMPSIASFQEGMILPPPMDPLDGLEVIVGGTWTVGTLRSIPKRRTAQGQNMFAENTINNSDDDDDDDDMAGSVMGYRRVDQQEAVISNEEKATASEDRNEEDDDQQLVEVQQAVEEAAKAQAEAEAAAAEAKRKAQKMEMLKQRAQEAMARRKKKNNK